MLRKSVVLMYTHWLVCVCGGYMMTELGPAQRQSKRTVYSERKLTKQWWPKQTCSHSLAGGHKVKRALKRSSPSENKEDGETEWERLWGVRHGLDWYGIAEIVCSAETPWLTHVSVASFSKATASEDGRVHPFKDAGAEKEGAVWEKWLDWW